MLYNADLETLAKVLKPDPEKISSKALKSVRSRVVNLCGYFDPGISAAEFLERLKFYLFEETDIINYEFTDDDIKQINIIKSEKYANINWLLGETPKFTSRFAKRFPAGKIEIFLDVERGVIKSCNIFGDFLGILPAGDLEKMLENQPYEFNIISEILSNTDLRLYLGGIKREELLECLF